MQFKSSHGVGRSLSWDFDLKKKTWAKPGEWVGVLHCTEVSNHEVLLVPEYHAPLLLTHSSPFCVFFLTVIYHLQGETGIIKTGQNITMTG